MIAIIDYDAYHNNKTIVEQGAVHCAVNIILQLY